MAGSTVIVATDLVGAAVEEWVDFAERVTHAGCPLVALVPYQPARCPPELAARMRIVHWDRSTSAARAARAVRDRPRPARERHREHDSRDLLKRAAFAARIEPDLLRRLRLELRLNLDAGAEADVWFGPWARFRGPDGFILAPEHAAALRAELFAEDEAAYDAAWEVTRRAHATAPAAVRVEEELRYLDGRPGTEDRARQLLQHAIGAVIGGGEDEALWAARAHAGLGEHARGSGGGMLEAAARLRLPDSLDGRDSLPPGPFEPWMTWLAPSTGHELGVRLLDGAVELSDPPAKGSRRLPVPRSRPFAVEFEQGGRRWREDLPRGESRQVPVQPGRVMLRNAAGDEFELTKRNRAPTASRDGSRLLRIIERGPDAYAVSLHVAGGAEDWLEVPVAHVVIPRIEVPLEAIQRMRRFEPAELNVRETFLRGDVARALERLPGRGPLLVDVRPSELRSLRWELLGNVMRVTSDFPRSRPEQERLPVLRVLVIVGRRASPAR